MTISKERIDVTARALAQSDFPDSIYDRMHIAWHQRYTRYARAALEADAPALKAAKVEGMQMAAQLYQEGVAIGTNGEISSWDTFGSYIDAIDAAIAQLEQQDRPDA